MKPRTSRPVLGLLMAVQILAWSFNYIFGKIALAHLDPLTTASFRLVLAGAIYLVIFLLAPRPAPVAWSDIPTLGLLGLAGVVINQGGFTISLDYTSVSHVAVIVAIGPVLVLLLAWLNRLETLGAVKILGMALSIAGVAILAAEERGELHQAALAGDLMALTSTAAFAFFTTYAKRVADRYDTVALNSFAHLTGAILVLPLALHQAARLDWRRVAWPGWAGLVYMAVFGSVIGYLAFYRLLENLRASQVSSLNYLLPIVATVLGVVLLHEWVNRTFVAAGALVLVGVWLAERGRWGRAAD